MQVPDFTYYGPLSPVFVETTDTILTKWQSMWHFHCHANSGLFPQPWPPIRYGYPIRGICPSVDPSPTHIGFTLEANVCVEWAIGPTCSSHWQLWPTIHISTVYQVLPRCLYFKGIVELLKGLRATAKATIHQFRKQWLATAIYLCLPTPMHSTRCL